jgi:hypothetical protein
MKDTIDKMHKQSREHSLIIKRKKKKSCNRVDSIDYQGIEEEGLEKRISSFRMPLSP